MQACVHRTENWCTTTLEVENLSWAVHSLWKLLRKKRLDHDDIWFWSNIIASQEWTEVEPFYEGDDFHEISHSEDTSKRELVKKSRIIEFIRVLKDSFPLQWNRQINFKYEFLLRIEMEWISEGHSEEKGCVKLEFF